MLLKITTVHAELTCPFTSCFMLQTLDTQLMHQTLCESTQ